MTGTYGWPWDGPPPADIEERRERANNRHDRAALRRVDDIKAGRWIRGDAQRLRDRDVDDHHADRIQDAYEHHHLGWGA